MTTERMKSMMMHIVIMGTLVGGFVLGFQAVIQALISKL